MKITDTTAGAPRATEASCRRVQCVPVADVVSHRRAAGTQQPPDAYREGSELSQSRKSFGSCFVFIQLLPREAKDP